MATQSNTPPPIDPEDPKPIATHPAEPGTLLIEMELYLPLGVLPIRASGGAAGA